MKIDKKSMLLYAITDRSWLGENSLEEQVEDAIKGGATFIQLREKDLPFDKFLKQAKKIKIITDKYKVPFVINDNIKVAIESDADGIHIGQKDMNAKELKALIGDNKILGVSANTVEEAKLAEKNGADYIGVGAVFPTATKEDADMVSLNNLKDICHSVSIPVVAIGGIKSENIIELKSTDIDGICLISAIFAEENIYNATRELYKLAKEIVE